MPACGQAVGCGVCDMPELWRGAAGLCARVRACAGAAESLHTYIYVPQVPSTPRNPPHPPAHIRPPHPRPDYSGHTAATDSDIQRHGMTEWDECECKGAAGRRHKKREIFSC